MGAKALKTILYNIILPLSSIVLLLLGWMSLAHAKPNVLASPPEVWDRLIQLFEHPIDGLNIFGHLWASLQRILVALSAALVIGVAMGFAIGWSKLGKATIGTLFEFIRPIPPLAWVPLITVWLGIGEIGKYTIVFIGCVAPIVVNTYTGVRMVERDLIDVARTQYASNGQIFREIVLPSALPAILTGLRNSVGVSLMVVLAAEMMGATSGLGFLILRGMSGGDIALILLGMISIGIVGALLSLLVSFLERKLCPWKEK